MTLEILTIKKWVNQIPTCAGLVDSQGKLCNIDLAQRDGNKYSLIELKYASNTPLYAAMEILQYGLLYVFSRRFMNQLGYDNKQMLDAKHVSLVALAPKDFYAGYSVGWLEASMTEGLELFTENKNYKMDFHFEEFPANFEWKCSDEQLQTAMYNRVKLYS
jgi:hypothetical protein